MKAIEQYFLLCVGFLSIIFNYEMELLTIKTCLFLLGKEKTDIQEETCSPTQAALTSDFDEAFSQLCDPFLPVRGHAMIKLASLICQRNSKAMESTDTLLKIFLEQLTHDDSYIYLAAIQGLVSLADIRADMVIPRLAHEFATCRKEASGVAAERKEDKEKGRYVPSKKGWFT